MNATKQSRRRILYTLLPVAVLSALLVALLLPRMPGLAPFLAGWWVLAIGLAALRWKVSWTGAALALPLALPPLAITLLLNFQAVRVSGHSMEPTFMPGDVLLVDRTARTPKPLATYVIEVQGERQGTLVKRLVGMPGQSLLVRYDRLFADGVEVHPRLGTPPDTWSNERPFAARGYLRGGMKLGPDQYCFIGDNPPASRDSRDFGPVSQSQFTGRVVWRLRGSGGFGPS